MFRKKKEEQLVQPIKLYNRPAKWPSGVAVSTPSGIWFIKKSKRYRCFSERSAYSWQFRLISAGNESVSKLPVGGVLGFRDGSLIKDVSDGKIYLVSDSKVRHITSVDALELFGEPMLVSHDEVKIHLEGEEINGI
jgi:hypothetical protein